MVRLNSLMHLILDLSYNSFKGQIARRMESLRNLFGLDLSYKNIIGAISGALRNMRML